MESRRSIFVTGCSSGIGRATAELFAERGWHVIAATRSGMGHPVHPLIQGMSLDVDSKASIEHCFRFLKDKGFMIDALVNNAGWGMKTPFDAMHDRDIERMFMTNALGPMRVTGSWLTMTKPDRGILINVGSMASSMGLKHYSAYAATKHALMGWSESLWYESDALGITVKIVDPLGKVHTNFFRSVEESAPSTLSAEDIAETIWEAATDGKKRFRYAVSRSTQLRLAIFLHRVCPSLAMAIFARRYKHQGRERKDPGTAQPCRARAATPLQRYWALLMNRIASVKPIRGLLYVAWFQRVMEAVFSRKHLVIHLPRLQATFRMNPINIAQYQEILQKGSYEPPVTAFIERHLLPGMTFVDVGANDGYFTVLAAKHMQSKGNILAIEPDPKSVRFLRANIAENALKEVTVAACCVSDVDGEATLNTTVISGLNSMVEENVRGLKRTCRVECATLDRLLQRCELQTVDVLKMDIQGMELRCLRGAERTLERNAAIRIVFEYWPIGLSNAGHAPEDLLWFLHERGFAIEPLDDIAWQDERDAFADLTALVDARGKDMYCKYCNLLAYRKALRLPQDPHVPKTDTGVIDKK